MVFTSLQVKYALLTLLLIPHMVKMAQKIGTLSTVITVTSDVHVIITLGKERIPSGANVLQICPRRSSQNAAYMVR